MITRVDGLPSDEIGLSLGECVHNLRSALDNLAFALARLRTDPPDQPEKIAFPIQAERRDGTLRSMLSQLPASARDVIERLQPFQRTGLDGTPEQDPLVMLQRLNNADKHRIPAIVMISPRQIDHDGSVEYFSEEDATADGAPDVTIHGGPLSEGVTFLEHRTRHPIQKVTGHFKIVAKVAVQLDSDAPELEPLLPGIVGYTRLVVSQFDRFFT